MNRAFKILFFLLFISQGIFVVFYSSSIPFMDEWETLLPNAFPAGFTWSWIFSQHNEHRIIWTKLQSWLLYYATGWDLRIQIAFNYFVLFGGILWILHRLLRFRSEINEAWLWLCLCFFCSPLLHQNHFWAFQSQFHFMILFLLLSAFFFFESFRLESSTWGLLFALACLYSFSSGVVASTVLTFSWILLGRKPWRQKMGVLAVFSIALFFWFQGFHRSGGSDLLMPWHLKFWPYFGDLISLGFGVNGRSGFLAGLCSAFVIVPMAWTVFRKRKHFSIGSVKLELALLLSVLAALATITMGRGASGLGAKSSRYAEISVLLIPLCLLGYSRILDAPKIKNRFIGAFFIFLFVSFIDDWRFNKTYLNHHLGMKDGEKCLKEYFQGKNPEAHCPTLYPGPLRSHLESGKDLKLLIWSELKK